MSLNRINQLIFEMAKRCVFFEVVTDWLNINFMKLVHERFNVFYRRSSEDRKRQKSLVSIIDIYLSTEIWT
jgi:hypothetical protein